MLSLMCLLEINVEVSRWQFKREDKTGDINMGDINIWIIFKAWGLYEITLEIRMVEKEATQELCLGALRGKNRIFGGKVHKSVIFQKSNEESI